MLRSTQKDKFIVNCILPRMLFGLFAYYFDQVVIIIYKLPSSAFVNNQVVVSNPRLVLRPSSWQQTANATKNNVILRLP